MGQNMIWCGSAFKMMGRSGAGAIRTCAQKKISLLAVALLEGNADCGTVNESSNGARLIHGDGFALAVCVA